MSDLRASPDASPPENMHRSLIYSGASICCGTVFVIFLRGQQRRREKDESIAAAAATATASSAQRQERHAQSSLDVEDGRRKFGRALSDVFRRVKGSRGRTS